LVDDQQLLVATCYKQRTVGDSEFSQWYCGLEDRLFVEAGIAITVIALRRSLRLPRSHYLGVSYKQKMFCRRIPTRQLFDEKIGTHVLPSQLNSLLGLLLFHGPEGDAITSTVWRNRSGRSSNHNHVAEDVEELSHTYAAFRRY